MGMRLLKPSPRLNEIAVGVLGRALALYDVRLYDIVFFGNHVQYAVGARDALALARFTSFFHGNLAREVGRLVGWRGRLWSRRGRVIPIVDDAALERRARYLYAHGVKEGLVASPLDWPGASSVKARVSGEPMRGVWVDRTAASQARRQGKEVGPGDFETEYEIELWPWPCWEALSEEEQRARVVGIVAELEEEAQERARDGERFGGAERVAEQDPFEIPERVARSPAPFCHGSTKESREAYRVLYLAFAAAFWEAADALVAGVLDAVFPEGSFPRPRPFVTPVESFAPS